MRREIVTIQVGEFANFIASHFWNFQTEASRGEELCERLRFFEEECDHIQGIKFLVDDSGGGFSALAASVLDVKRAVDASYNTKLLFHNLSVSRCPLPVPLPFPSIFGNLVGRRGEILSTPGSDSMYRGSLDVHSLPVATRWRPSSVILPFLESRLGNLERLGIQRGAMGSYVARKWGFGEEELQDMRENLSNMASKLSPHHSSDSDSDSD
ncbi:hypothetical protein F2Q69_00032759 [Brassica cretica]|uniref:Misato Segment II tubulin-like domain-containing protein n=1 Tax=Brassica cretica TaxID=69181 RepID=A0A8S9SS13_BRACR|nr:hypothetical protein F2Q69_00032759 [Brassica cretica]